jgi:hypothetical protein
VTEIRIYYECLEQAAHYLKPMVEAALRSMPIVAIRLVKNPKRVAAQNLPQVKSVLQGIYSLVVPEFC